MLTPKQAREVALKARQTPKRPPNASDRLEPTKTQTNTKTPAKAPQKPDRKR